MQMFILISGVSFERIGDSEHLIKMSMKARMKRLFTLCKSIACIPNIKCFRNCDGQHVPFLID